MAFTQSKLLSIAKLARLSLKPDELDRFCADLNNIVQLVLQLNEVDVTGVTAMAHAKDRTMQLREDKALATLGLACVSSSQGYEDGFIKVPKIVE